MCLLNFQSDPSPNTDTSALQGAQGLLAGMTLLNELEPDVDGIYTKN